MDEKLKCPHKRIDHNGECLDCDEPVWATPIAKPDINVEAALKRLSELEPIIQEVPDHNLICGSIAAIRYMADNYPEDDLSPATRWDLHMICTLAEKYLRAANRIAKIGGVDA